MQIGLRPRGAHNAITDVRGVLVGHCTVLDEARSPPVRTGVTVVVPRGGEVAARPVFAGCHRFNGNGDVTGLEWVRDGGVLATPIGLTNTNSVGCVRDALAHFVRSRRTEGRYWAMPVVAETYDGILSDIDGEHVARQHVLAALEAAAGGSVPQGAVGAGTGLICHEFRGGIGTSSRVLGSEEGGWAVGALVQANHGARERLCVDGLRVGGQLPCDEFPSPIGADAAGAGSIVIVVATDAPLLPHQCQRLAAQAAVGLARSGGGMCDASGDFSIAFAQGNDGIPLDGYAPPAQRTHTVQALANGHLSPLFEAAAEAVEESIINALLASRDTGPDSDPRALALSPEMLKRAIAAAAAAAASA